RAGADALAGTPSGMSSRLEPDAVQPTALPQHRFHIAVDVVEVQLVGTTGPPLGPPAAGGDAGQHRLLQQLTAGLGHKAQPAFEQPNPCPLTGLVVLYPLGQTWPSGGAHSQHSGGARAG